MSTKQRAWIASIIGCVLFLAGGMSPYLFTKDNGWLIIPPVVLGGGILATILIGITVEWIMDGDD